MKIHLIFEGSEWNYATKEYDSVDQSRIFEKVRVHNLDRFINDLEEYEAVEDKYIMT
jgi:ribosomal protein L20A (L18A)